VKYAAALVALLIVCITPGISAPENAPDIAYDQIVRAYTGAPAPAVTDFDDFKSSLAPTTPEDVGDGYPAATMSALPTDAATAQRMRDGIFYHYSFMGTLVRIDDAATMRATIVRPDRLQVIHLDLLKKTYQVISGEAARNMIAYDPQAAVRAVLPSGLPTIFSGTENFQSSQSETTVAGRTFDGIATNGDADTITETPGAITGNCPPLSVQTTIVRYVDPTRTEHAPDIGAFQDQGAFFASLPALGCKLSVGTPSPAPSADPQTSGFLLYMRVDLALSTPLSQRAITSTLVLERGNVTPLGPTAASLFEVPPDFKGG